MNDLKYRILEILNEQFQGNKSEMARYINANQPSIKKYIDGESFPAYEVIYNICTNLGISANWLILGEGEKIIAKENTPSQKVVGLHNTNITLTQIMHSKDILTHENESLKRENTLLREMLDIYKNQLKK